MIELHLGDCLNVLRAMPEMSVDAIVTDPPYGLSFMGKKWDYDVPSVEIWRECLRVLKPGGHLLSFAGTRTQHRMAVNIEDAGFQIRDLIFYCYGQGFPKSLDISKAIDKMAGAEREVVGESNRCIGPSQAGANGIGTFKETNWSRSNNITAPATEAARQWNGFGTSLKPSLEPVTVARRPIIGTVAENVLKYGTGGINVDGCRVPTDDNLNGGGYSGGTPKTMFSGLGRLQPDNYLQPTGRFPANLIHDGSDEVVGLFPDVKTGNIKPYLNKNVSYRPGQYDGKNRWNGANFKGDSGSAARFFYCAKASKADRDEGCEELEERHAPHGNYEGRDMENPKNHLGGLQGTKSRNHHPTVKPTALMRYLCRLVTPPGGIVLDPFMGSGSTGKAAVLENFNFIGIEREPEYMEIARRRIHAVQPKPETVNDSVTYVQPSLF